MAEECKSDAIQLQQAERANFFEQYGSTASPGKEPEFETTQAEAHTKALSAPITRELILKMVRHWQEIGLMSESGHS